jgi:hypothetical protein
MQNLKTALLWFISIVEDKAHPGHLSATRVMALAWGLTSCALALILVLALGVTDHLLVAELIGASLVALGLRNLWNGSKKED